MIQIIKISNFDDNEASLGIEVMVCSSIPCAKEIILDLVNKDFDGTWDDLSDAAHDLNRDLDSAEWDDANKTFVWFDNGKGETYVIARINEREVNTKFQKVIFL